MALIEPFTALRPDPALAKRICELPYDVLSSAEARQIARDNPLSFLRVSKPEIELLEDQDPYAPAVYARGRTNLERLIQQRALLPDTSPGFYLYRQVQGAHAQVGIVGLASCADYLHNVIKKHELTRPDKEDDRARHIQTLNAQTGPAFLIYRAVPALDRFVGERTMLPPDTDFVADDGVRHTAWPVKDPAGLAFLRAGFAGIPSLYIADGHHRSAAAVRVYQARRGAGTSEGFLAVLFPHTQVRILPYHRVLKDLYGLTPAGLCGGLADRFGIQPAGAPQPAREHEVGLYLAGRWHTLAFPPSLLEGADRIDQLDVSLLQRHLLGPVLGIDDPRTSKRIGFVGGIRSTVELERLVNGGEYACAFSLFPTQVEDLLAIADTGGIMPPKSTWFEPKLRDGMFSHLI